MHISISVFLKKFDINFLRPEIQKQSVFIIAV